MHRKTRQAATRPGTVTNARELGERLRLSRERLAASELATIGRAWRLWAAFLDATVGYSRAADRTYATTLGKAAGIDRQAASSLLRRFDELGVFEWHAAPRGSRAISELRLPRLEGHTWSGHHMISDEAHQSGGLGTTLQSNTSQVPRSKAIPTEPLTQRGGEPMSPQAGRLEGEGVKAGTPREARPEEVRAPGPLPGPFAHLTTEELARGVEELGPTMAALYRDELERRAYAANPLRATIARRFPPT
jgi:hypothetical protein